MILPRSALGLAVTAYEVRFQVRSSIGCDTSTYLHHTDNQKADDIAVRQGYALAHSNSLSVMSAALFLRSLRIVGRALVHLIFSGLVTFKTQSFPREEKEKKKTGSL